MTRLLSFVLLAAAALGVVRAETSVATGTMTIARSGHQATLLVDGRVLVTGGSDEKGQAIGLAEIFDPLTHAWSPAAPNLVPRLGHSAARLQDGRVLVVGGSPSASSCQSIASAEIYDLSTDRWSMTANIPVAVGLGTVAVALKDGRVLVSGGGGCGEVFRSAALFDPVGNTWSRTTSMGVPAQFHIATMLADGRVIVSGGTPAGTAPDFVASVYDPTSAAWTRAPEPRPLTGTVCDGYVRTYSSALSRNSLIARATRDDCTSVTVLPGGKLMMAGGLSNDRKSALDTVGLTDLRTDEGFAGWEMSSARTGHTATRLKNGVVLIAGGRNVARRLASSELYVPRLPYDAGPSANARDNMQQINYGRYLAAATNSRRHLLISYEALEGMRFRFRLLEWAPAWGFGAAPSLASRNPLRALGQDLPSLNSIRVDRRDDIWGVASAGREIVKIGSDGRVLLRFGKPPRSDEDSALDAASRSRRPQYVETPSDLALDEQGNVFVVDAGERPRIVKFDASGRFVAETGGLGSNPGSLNTPHSVATDADGNVYVADSGNARIQVFDNSLKVRAVYRDAGTPWALCTTSGSRQFLYSVSSPDRVERSRTTGELYKLELDGTILGKAIPEPGRTIGPIDQIHCPGANVVVVAGFHNLRRITLAR